MVRNVRMKSISSANIRLIANIGGKYLLALYVYAATIEYVQIEWTQTKQTLNGHN